MGVSSVSVAVRVWSPVVAPMSCGAVLVRCSASGPYSMTYFVSAPFGLSVKSMGAVVSVTVPVLTLATVGLAAGVVKLRMFPAVAPAEALSAAAWK